MTIDVKCTEKYFQSALIWDQNLRTLKKKKFSKYADKVDIDALWKKNCAGHVEFVKNLKYERDVFV